MTSSFYAIVNLSSESVKQNIYKIESAINNISKLFETKVASSYRNIYGNNLTDSSWEKVDIQFDEAKKYEYVLVFGGDGTKTHILNRIINEKTTVKFIGISCGTMNIGSYSSSIDDLLENDIYFEQLSLSCLACECNDTKSYAFIDSIISTTCVTKVDGTVSQISASKILKGTRKRDIPQQVGTESTQIIVTTNGKEIVFPQMSKIYTIGAALIRGNLAADVLSGGADPASCVGFDWGCVVSDFPLVWADVRKSELQKYPINTCFFPLDGKDRIKIKTLCNNAFLINDGNAITKTTDLEICFIKDIIKVMKIKPRS